MRNCQSALNVLIRRGSTKLSDELAYFLSTQTHFLFFSDCSTIAFNCSSEELPVDREIRSTGQIVEFSLDYKNL